MPTTTSIDPDYQRLPAIPGGLLADLRATWERNRWDLRDLEAFRMADDGGDDGDGDGDGDEDGDDDDGKAGTEELEARLRKLNKENQKHRLRAKPYVELEREFGVSADEVREILAKLKGSSKPPKKDDTDDGGTPVDPDEIRRQVEQELTEKTNRRIIRSEIKALAADLFADPADAPLYLDLDDYEVDEDGEVDEEQILADLKNVLKRKPHLAKGTTDNEGDKPSRRPKPIRGQGKGTERTASVDAGRELYEARRPKKS